MDEGLRLYKEQGAAALWKRTLGYLDYSLEQTMDVQHALLAEQLRFFRTSPLHQQMLGGVEPQTTAEFRERVPLTSYDDYDTTLGEQRDDVLAEKPFEWIRTSGRTAGRHKWVPIGPRAGKESLWVMLGTYIAAAASERGEIAIPPGVRTLNLTAPPPYGSGTLTQGVADEIWPSRMYPTLNSDSIPFEQRMGQAFSSAVTNGVDLVASQASVMANIGETFGSRRPPGSILDRMKNIRAFGRMGRAALRAKAAARPIYPRDAWKLRAIIVGGMDSSLFRERIREYWGRYPLELLVSSEGLVIGHQGWDYTTLTLVPTLNFFEFIPDDELARETADPTATPRTVLMDELEPGRNYEIVLTNLHGSPMIRYRTGDILRFTSMRNERTGIALPQAVFYGRRSDLMSLGGLVNLTEQALWRAIEDSGVPYVDWIARKEVEDSNPTLHLRLEPRPANTFTAMEAQERIHQALKRVEPDWTDLEEIAGLKPLRVTYLPGGCFERYVERRRAAGADIGQLKPIHMSPTDSAMDALAEVVESLEAVR